MLRQAGTRPTHRIVPTSPKRERSRRLMRLDLALRFTLLLLCLGLVPDMLAQQTEQFEWLAQFGLEGNDFAWDIDADGQGIVYVAGDGALPGQHFFGGARDAFVRKYAANGHELWTRQFGTNGSDQCFAVFRFCADSYVGGLTTGAFSGYVNLGGADAYLRKYDANGNERWTRQFGTAGNDEVIGIFVDTTGMYVTGRVGGELPGQMHKGMFDAFVRKYDLDGNDLWTHQFGATGQDAAFRISGDDSGIYVAGSVAGVLPGQTPAGGVDAFIRKYDGNGNEVWTRQFGTSAVDLAIDVNADAAGVFLVGRTDGTLAGQTPGGGADAFVRQYDVDGNELWTRQFGTSLFDLARGVSVRDSVVYVSGVVGGPGPVFRVVKQAQTYSSGRTRR
jgi:hypothetical protein